MEASGCITSTVVQGVISERRDLSTNLQMVTAERIGDGLWKKLYFIIELKTASNLSPSGW